MVTLTADEARVLGVLIEKAQTTPDQYPLSLNAIVNGSNQKNNRDPVIEMSESAAFEAAEGLREKGLAARVDQVGGRVHKYRHTATEALHARTAELVILAELLLRGPQTLGELRGRASRMHPLESLDRVKEMIRALTDRPQPYVQELPPSPGSRAERYMQLIAPDLHPVGEVTTATGSTDAADAASAKSPSDPAGGKLAQRLAHLEEEIHSLRELFAKLASAVGEEAIAQASRDDRRHFENAVRESEV
jgi:uncharacterized protein YceH (UPF0502 family)